MACCIKSCLNNKKKCLKIGLSYHQFPKGKDQASKCFEAIGSNLRSGLNNNRLRICSQHSSNTIDDRRFQAVPCYFSEIESQLLSKDLVKHNESKSMGPRIEVQFIKKEEPVDYVLISTSDGEIIDDLSSATISNVTFDNSTHEYTVKQEPEEYNDVSIKTEVTEHSPTSLSEHEPDSVSADDDSAFEDSNGASISSKRKSSSKFKCKYCPMSFDRNATLLQHISVHNRPEMDQCKICHRFFHKLKLQKHVENRHSKVSFSCPVCLKVLKSQKSLVSHHTSFHLGLRYECDICAKVFRQKYTLLGHFKLHRERKRDYKCEKCEFSFYRRCNLNRHMERKHTGEKFRRCLNPSCNRRLKLSSFDSHKCPMKRRTEGERNFKCSKCERGFFNKELLRRHLRKIDCGESQKLICGKCNRSFKRLHCYLDHVAQNCDEKMMYECDYCSKSFTCKYSLRQHFGAVHNIDEMKSTVSCKKCNKVLSTNSKLNMHMKKLHKS